VTSASTLPSPWITANIGSVGVSGEADRERLRGGYLGHGRCLSVCVFPHGGKCPAYGPADLASEYQCMGQSGSDDTRDGVRRVKQRLHGFDSLEWSGFPNAIRLGGGHYLRESRGSRP
jgi:hypothetical protein